MNIKDEAVKKIRDASIAVGTGAVAGAGVYATVGGIGLAGLGTAVGITLLPMIGIGAGLAGIGYGLFRLGKG